MKKLAFSLVVALSGTLNAQSIDKDSSNILENGVLDKEFEDGVMLELGNWNFAHKVGDNDSLTFALLPTLFTNPATKYEFEKINPRIATEVFVGFQVENGDMRQLTFIEWIQTEVYLLDSAIWDIKLRTTLYDVFDSKIRSELIDLTNKLTGQTRQIFFNYNDDSLNGSVTNMFAIVDQRYN
jgi:hypothetical protein